MVIDTRGLEFALYVVFSVPAALVLGLMASLIAWAIPPRTSFLWSIYTGAGLGIVAGLVGAAVSVFSVPAALILGLLASLIAWAIPHRASFLWSIYTGAGLGIAAGLVGAAVSWVTWVAWDKPANAADYTNVSIIYWTVIGLLSIGEVAAVVYAARHKPQIGLPDALA